MGNKALTKRGTLECLGEIVEIYIDENGDVVFDGWDEKAEMAFIGFGDTERSPCWRLARIIDEDRLDEEMFNQAGRDALTIVDVLITAGADVNVKGYNDITPLHDAASLDDICTTSLLLEHGANVYATDNDGQTPLHHAAHNNSLDAAELLLEAGADVNAKDNNGETPLHWAVTEPAYWTRMPALLIEKGADVNARDKRGNTPLHLAVCTDQEFFIVELLLKNGANVHAITNDGETPLQVAEECGLRVLRSYHAIDLLKKWGAKR